jgi:cold shock CspA family protein
MIDQEDKMSDRREQGVIKVFKAQRGFGFIEADHGESGLFFHVQQYQGDENALVPGVRVSFDIGRSKDGRPKAIGVTLVDDRALTEPVATQAPRGTVLS